MRILVVDDYELVRRGICSVLAAEPTLTICGEAVDGGDAVEKARALQPDIVIMDISMPNMTGLQATKEIKRLLPHTEIVIVSQHQGPEIIRQAFRAGADGYIAKSEISSDLLAAIAKCGHHENSVKSARREEGLNSPEQDLPDAAVAPPPAVSSSLLDLGSQTYLTELLPMAAYAVRAPDGVIAWFNSRAAELWGRAPVLGETDERFCGADRLFYPDGTYMAHCDTPVALALSTGASVHEQEVVIARPDGSRVTVSVHIDPIRDKDGTIVGAVNFFHDITEQKQTEEVLRKNEEQLRTLADELEKQVGIRTQELEQRNAEVLQQSDQLRELSKRVVQTQDEERRRIARDLHDSAGQILAALCMNLSSLTQQIEHNRALAKPIRDSQELVQQLNKEIRTISYLLHPPLLEETGLSNAIRLYMDGLAERSGLEIELNIPNDFGRLPRDVELAVFRIVQECLTNIHRHSGSKTAAIKVSRNSDTVSLEIQDQGNGISAEKLAKIQGQRSGVGITGMRERVRHLKGVMDIQSNGKGTRILVTLPSAIADTSERGSAASTAFV